MSNRLHNKTAIVTGASTGLGYDIARQFLEEGAKGVIITGTNQQRLEEAAASLGDRAVPVVADVRKRADLDALAAKAKAAFGAVDILVANAGVGSFAPIEQVDEAAFDNQFDINVKGVYFTVQAALPVLSDGASILLTASAVHEKGFPTGSVYFATKAAVRSLARTFAAELAPRGIRVNSLSPGLVPTPFVGKMGMPADVLEGFSAQVTGLTPLGRTGTPEEIGGAAVFLASGEASYVTGADLTVDGGFMNV